jgi:hypothetical protein
MKHIVHCSGYSLAEQGPDTRATRRDGMPAVGRFHDWTEVCIGDPAAGRLGRIPMAIAVAEAVEAALLIWSTGATYLGTVSEAEVMRRAALDYLERGSLPTETIRRISALETESTDTRSSALEAARMVERRFGGEPLMLHLVTSANHAPRLAREAALAFAQLPRVVLSIVPAHTSYGRKRPEDAVIRDLGS